MITHLLSSHVLNLLIDLDHDLWNSSNKEAQISSSSSADLLQLRKKRDLIQECYPRNQLSFRNSFQSIQVALGVELFLFLLL